MRLIPFEVRLTSEKATLVQRILAKHKNQLPGDRLYESCDDENIMTLNKHEKNHNNSDNLGKRPNSISTLIVNLQHDIICLHRDRKKLEDLLKQRSISDAQRPSELSLALADREEPYPDQSNTGSSSKGRSELIQNLFKQTETLTIKTQLHNVLKRDWDVYAQAANIEDVCVSGGLSNEKTREMLQVASASGEYHVDGNSYVGHYLECAQNCDQVGATFCALEILVFVL